MNLLTNAYYYGGRGYRYGYSFDRTYLLAVLGLILTLAASAFVKNTFNRYAKVRSMSGLTGAAAAREVLRRNGLEYINIQHIAGSLTDHYDPRSKTLRLSDSTYSSTSVAAICVACHECGHAIQDKEKYGPLVLRGTLVPAANFGSRLAWPVFIAGMVFSLPPLMTVGIILFSLAVIFQLVTLPVEFNASHRALKILEEGNIIPQEEVSQGRKVLIAAAMTYVAALASSALQLL